MKEQQETATENTRQEAHNEHIGNGKMHEIPSTPTGTESVTPKEADLEEKQETTKDSDDDTEYPHGAKLAIILAALCLSIFLVALDQTIISTAIPKITDHFHSIQDIGWVCCCSCP